MEILFKNIRCFTRENRVSLKPITLVTGENSSGKSTLLAIISAILKSYRFPSSPSFNEPPFNLGNYETIATYKGGKYGRSESFTLGYKNTERNPTEVVAIYTNNRGVPTLSNLKITSNISEIAFDVKNGKINISGTLHKNKKDEKTSFDFSITIPEAQNETAKSWINIAFRFAMRDSGLQEYCSEKNVSKEITNAIYHALDSANGLMNGSAQPIAPLRTKPLRTYDQSKADYSPDGDHIPYTLAKLFDERKNNKESSGRITALIRFGIEAGLFTDLKVKVLGKNISDPFQILVTASGRPANLIDVGYGVSQSLPIIVQSISASKSQYNLVQQPEVHLHPKAQAAFGSFFCDLAVNQNKKFVIETHSDFIIDRIRQHIAEKIIPAENVSLLYLERKGHDTIIHDLKFDINGNIINPPQGYRNFFLREDIKMLKLASK